MSSDQSADARWGEKEFGSRGNIGNDDPNSTRIKSLAQTTQNVGRFSKALWFIIKRFNCFFFVSDRAVFSPNPRSNRFREGGPTHSSQDNVLVASEKRSDRQHQRHTLPPSVPHKSERERERESIPWQILERASRTDE